MFKNYSKRKNIIPPPKNITANALLYILPEICINVSQCVWYVCVQ